MAKTIDIKVPDIGDFDQVPVIEVLVSAGDKVAKDDSLLTLESDKATMEVPASDAGTITQLKVKVGDEVSEGDVIATLEVDADDADQADDDSSDQDSTDQDDSDQDQSGQEDTDREESDQDNSEHAASGDDAEQDDHPPAPTAHKTESAAADSTDDATAAAQSSHASPGVRKLARKLEIDIGQVRGTGRKGRITADDLHQHIRARMHAGSAGGVDMPTRKQIDFSKFGDIETQPLSRIQRKSGLHLYRNWITIPHVTQHDVADITELEAFRQQHNAQTRDRGSKLSMVAFLIQASVKALQQFPQFNASLSHDGSELILKHYHHIGVAVDTEHGLVVPVIRDADRKGLLELAEELGELSTLARDGKLKPEQMQGGCFSISSLGGIGGTSFTPIVNGPEVAILGVSRASQQPQWDESSERFVPRLMLPLSLSYDHRVIDGADAARFTRYLADGLSDLRRLLL
ncbi:MAG: dihydrolipoyllysine-residue acetyltransferase [Wenzhouxiangellaceae bacterium]